MQRGRKSEASSNVIQLVPGPKRNLHFSKMTESAIYGLLIDKTPHIRDLDTPLLAIYARTLAEAFRLTKGKDTVAAVQATRLALSLATKLRLTPQSRINPVTVGRQQRDQQNANAAAVRGDSVIGDDNDADD